MKSAITISAVVGAVLALLQPAQAQEDYFKDKTVRIIVGSAPGGGYDAYARVVGDHLRKHLPGSPQIVIQNMPGAGSLVAMNHIANVAAHVIADHAGIGVVTAARRRADDDADCLVLEERLFLGFGRRNECEQGAEENIASAPILERRNAGH